MNRNWYRRYGKRLIDVTVSGAGIALLFPVLAMIALATLVTMGRPVLFRQARPGLNEQVFTIFKFRTMSDCRDADGEMLRDAMRVTRIGKMLRAASLDELPELWNVFLGDMSLVGPRPLLVEYLPFYSREQRKRHDVRPGITGLAQICGRNQTTWEQRLTQDVFYVENLTLWLDCKIIARTIAEVLRGDGGTDAVERLGKFRGSESAYDTACQRPKYQG